jgi:hypothetical protein
MADSSMLTVSTTTFTLTARVLGQYDLQNGPRAPARIYRPFAIFAGKRGRAPKLKIANLS